jgi:hypothetical protein
MRTGGRCRLISIVPRRSNRSKLLLLLDVTAAAVGVIDSNGDLARLPVFSMLAP